MKAKKSIDRVLSWASLSISILALAVALGAGDWIVRSVVLADETRLVAGDGKLVAGWQAVQDDEYGVRLQHPARWLVQEADGLVSDSPVERTWLLIPRNQTGGVSPVTIEVGVGDLGELEGVWPGLSYVRSDAMTAVGYRMLTWQSPGGERFYVLGHPGTSRLWVAFRDSGGDADGHRIVGQMVDTFEFTLIHPVVPQSSEVQ